MHGVSAVFLNQFIHSKPSIPPEHRRNFLHLYFDIGWAGVLMGSLLTFASIYLTRIGATPQQLGWYTAIPAVVTLVLALPAGWWLKDKQLDRAAFWSALFFRLFYLIWLPLPLLLAPTVQIRAILLVTLVMSGPGTFLAISFNAMFATVVPLEWRNHVIGIRHGASALASITSSLLCGFILEWLPFTTGYQVVFGIGVVAAGMSTLHLWFVRGDRMVVADEGGERPFRDFGRPGRIAALREALPDMSLRYLLRRRQLSWPRVATLQGGYGRVMALVFFFFLALNLANPLYYPYWVGELHFGDQLLSMGTAVFYFCQFLSALQLRRISRLLGDRKTLALGAALLCAYPGLTALSSSPVAMLVAAGISGAAWGLAGGALLAYLYGVIPDGERPRYLAWYSLLTNLAILVGSLLGPQIAVWVGLRLGLGIAGIIRLLSGLFIWLLGETAHKHAELSVALGADGD